MEEFKLNIQNEKHHKSNLGVWIGVTLFLVLFALSAAVIIKSNKTDPINSSNYLTYSNYCKIQNNMSYSEVVSILGGHSGVLDTTSSYGGYTLSYYTWTNYSSTKCIVVGFENNKVITKTQYGLN